MSKLLIQSIEKTNQLEVTLGTEVYSLYTLIELMKGGDWEKVTIYNPSNTSPVGREALALVIKLKDLLERFEKNIHNGQEIGYDYVSATITTYLVNSNIQRRNSNKLLNK